MSDDPSPTPSPSSRGPVLAVLSGNRAGAVLPLDPAHPLVLGRGELADVVLADAKASREHVEIAFSDGLWRTRDLGSRNGTLLNGSDLGQDPVALKPGDRLRIGLTELEFAAAPTATGTRLRVVEGAEVGREYPIRDGRAVLGRKAPGRTASHDIQLPDEGASREHAEVRLSDGVWMLRDLGSRNGTALEGDRIDRAVRLRSGARLRVGLTVLQFLDGRVDDLAGTRLGDWELEARVGSGSLGVVYRARGADGEALAVKVLDGGLACDPGELARVANAWSNRIEDTHLVALRGHVAKPVPAVAMAWLPRGSLAERLAGGQTIAWSQLLPMARDLVRGLAAAAAKGQHHRGLRPSNLLFDAEGAVHVGDLGLCQSWDPTRPEESPDPHWLAPEEVDGRASDERSNQFSLGLILYQALTGRLPFIGSDRKELARARLAGGLPAPTTFAEVPPAVERLLARLLARDPADRFPGWAEVEAACEAAATGRFHAAPAAGRSVLQPLAAAAAAPADSGDSAYVVAPTSRRQRTVSRQLGMPSMVWGGLVVVGLMVAAALMLGTPGTGPAPATGTTPTGSRPAGGDPARPETSTPTVRSPASTVTPGLPELDRPATPGPDRLVRSPDPVTPTPPPTLAKAAPEAVTPTVAPTQPEPVPITVTRAPEPERTAPPTTTPTAPAPAAMALPKGAHPRLRYCRAGMWEKATMLTSEGEQITADIQMVADGVKIRPGVRTIPFAQIQQVDFPRPSTATEGDSLLQRRRFDEAIAAYAKALDRDAGNPYLSSRRDEAEGKARQVADANDQVPKAILAGQHKSVLDRISAYIALVQPTQLEPAWSEAFEKAWTAESGRAGEGDRSRWQAAAKAVHLKLCAPGATPKGALQVAPPR